jgi:DNA-binding MarR family transcriptional regulator
MERDRRAPYEIGPLLRRAHRKAANAFTAALQSLDLQSKHFGVLLTLHRAGPLSQRQLIERLDSDKSSMVRLIDELEARDLCSRTKAEGDRRAYAVQLTDAGRKVFAEAERTATTVSEALLSGFAPKECQQLQDLLTRFINHAAADND